MSSGRIYVGNLPVDIQRKDLEELFTKYGKIRLIELKSYEGSATFAFIQYEDPRDAEDAIHGRNGYEFGNVKLRVEKERQGGVRERGGYSRGAGRYPNRGGYSRGGGYQTRERNGPKRSDYRVIVTGLPPTGSWQDLKDHMREAGQICYTDVQQGSGEGVVEFVRREDMEYAVRTLDRTEFCSHKGETTFIRVLEDRMMPRWNRSRSRSRSRGRYSPQYYDRGSPPPRYYSPPPRGDVYSRRYQAQYSPPPRSYR